MPQKTNLNVNPYFEDFDANKNFYKILFRPGYSIQGRELTQLQSILQNQIESFGKYTFKQGDLVIPGEVGLNNKLDYVKLSSVSEVAVSDDAGNIVYKKYDISQLVGKQLVGLTSGVIGNVVSTKNATETNSDTLFVIYTTSGNANNESTFRQGESLEVINGVNTPIMVVGTDGSVLPTAITVTNPDTDEESSIVSPAMGYASAVKVEEGIYFVNGFFVRNDEQLLVIDPYYNSPSAKIGFQVSEDIVTPEEDNSLYDNAIGSSNFSAPGAHRLSLSLTLKRFDLSAQTGKNFILLLRVKQGVIQKKVVQADYSILEQTLARRTYDESGDYVVDNFSVDVREYQQKNGNNGVYAADAEGNYNGLSEQDASEKMISSVGPGKAYIRGYEIVNKETKFLEISKARETLEAENRTIKTRGLPTYQISNVYGSTPLNSEGSDLTAYPDVELFNVFTDGTIGQNFEFGSTQKSAEDPTGRIDTVDRRGTIYSDNDGIKTVTVTVTKSPTNLKVNPTGTAAPTIEFNDLCDSSGFVYSVGTRASGLPATFNTYRLIGFSLVTRPDVQPGDPGRRYVELTLLGNKGQLAGLTEYDAEGAEEREFLYLGTTTGYGTGSILTFSEGTATTLISEADNDYDVTGTASLQGSGAQFRVSRDATGAITDVDLLLSGQNYTVTETITILGSDIGGVDGTDDLVITVTEIDPSERLGYIEDYNSVITPLIGSMKPSNFFLKEKGFGFNEDTDVVLSKGTLSNGQKAYNSVFGFSYFAPKFYTRIVLESQPSTGFTQGTYVVGATSGAFGVVEGTTDSSFSSSGILMVTTLSGKFKSGEVLRDEDLNTAKIATDNTISHFIAKYQGTGGYPQGTDLTIDGVTFDTSKVQVVTDAGGFGYIKAVQIRDRKAFTQTYSQPPVVRITPGGVTVSIAARVDAILYRNSVIDYTPEDVKSFGAYFGAQSANKFTADVESTKTEYVTFADVTEFTFSGTKGLKLLECTSFGGDASVSLKQGDYIQFTGTDGTSVRTMIQYATRPEGTLKSQIYLDKALPEDVVNSTVIKLVPKIDNYTTGSLIYPLGSNIASVSRGSDDSKIEFYYRRDFVTDASTSGSNITFTAQLPFGTQRFVSFDDSNFLLTVLDPGDSTTVKKGDVVYITSDNISTTNTTDLASGLNAGSVTINLPTTTFNATSSFPKLKLSATLELKKARPRIKTSIKNKRILIRSVGDRVVPFRGEDYDADSTLLTSYSDAYRLRYVYEGSSVAAPEVDTAGNLVGTGTDITERFTFDDGQRDTFYDISRIVLKPGFPAPTGQLVIAFDYFEHSQGDFCTIDSYIHEAGVTLDEVPSFNSSVNGIVSLKNVLDFRPKVDDSSYITGYAGTSSRQEPTTNFTGSAGVISVTPAPDTRLEYTFKFSQTEFLNRIDSIFLNKKGEFVVKEGFSSQNPTRPEPLDDAIPLYHLYVPAFTTSNKDVRITPVDNRRYTMKDIGKLEKRIERLEYYTTLSILEQQALGMQITDSVGFSKLKTGFIVDNFETHLRGEVSSPDYKCSIDTQQSVLRSPNNEGSLKLVEVNSRNDQRVIDHYTRSGNIITLPYTQLEILGNDSATKTINPNPFVAQQYVGDAQLSPSIDPWYDRTTEPLIVDNNTQLYSIFIAKDNVRESFSSIFNSFVINWIGSKNTFGQITSFGSTNSDSAAAKVQAASVNTSSNVSPQNNEIGKGLSTDSNDKGTIATSVKYYARSVPVRYKLTRMKPFTTLYPFMEGRDISRWTNPDNKFTGIAGNSLAGFNATITTDENGNASGLILIPAGYPPVESASWTGDKEKLEYDETAEQVRFTTGIKTIRFTSSSDNAAKAEVGSYSEVSYYAVGRLPENPATINSTLPSKFKANEGVQIIDSTTDQEERPNPLAQTFKIENFEGGCFLTGLDLFFKNKSDSIPLRVYLTNTESEKPGKYILPGSEVSLSPNTLIRVFANGNATIKLEELITGSKSNASGPLLKVLDKNNIELVASSLGEVNLTNQQVYTLVLNNHNGKSFIQNEDLIIGSLTTFNAQNNTNLIVTIAKDSGKVSELVVKEVGANYESAVLAFESPQLPGGSVANGSASISDGKIYLAEATLFGSEYTAPPAIVVRGVGNGAGGAVIEAKISIDNPAVRMGIATDFAGQTESTTPTRFNFENPVYVQNNTQYTLVVETDSTEYGLYVSRLGETELSTSATVTTQPLLGSVYKSQNTEGWTEDLFEDIKFSMYRAEFDISRKGGLKIQNETLGFEQLEANPFETDASSGSQATSPLFRNNNKIVKVTHPNHGFEDRGDSYVYFRNAKEVGGVPGTQLNTRLYKVQASGVNEYHIESTNVAAGNTKGGGLGVIASYNKKFERLYPQVNYLTFSDTKVETLVKTTNVVPVDSTTNNYVSYSQTENEKTFLNEIHYFNNQKMVCSDINQTFNNLTNSLEYHIDLSSSVSYLSPSIDLSSASVKYSSNLIEKSTGLEDRYGRRDQIITFKDVYFFALADVPVGTTLYEDQIMEGYETQARGTIAKVEIINGAYTVVVRVSTKNSFRNGEGLLFSDTRNSGLNWNPSGNSGAGSGVKVGADPVRQVFTASPGASIVARDPSNLDSVFTNKIEGKVVFFDSQDLQITLRNDKAPISGTTYYQSVAEASTANGSAARTGSGPVDIFRAGDIISYPNQPDSTKDYWEIKTIDYTTGIDHTAETTFSNSSSIAKYTTKEISIGNPGSSIDVRITANIKNIDDILILYRTKKSSSQETFETIEWQYFNGTGLPDTADLPTVENTISGIVEKQSSYQELKYSVANLPEFSSFAIKIVMRSDDPVYVPKIQDLRAVASY